MGTTRRWLSLLVLCVLWVSVGHAEITCTDTPTTSMDFGVTSVAWSHTVGSANDRLLLVGSTHLSGGVPPDISSVTFGAQSLTQLITDTNSDFLQADLWYLLAPTVQTADITITYAGGVNAVTGAVSCAGVAQTSTFSGTTSAVGTDTTPTVNVTSSAGRLVFDFMGTVSLSATVGAGQTELYQANNDTNLLAGSSREDGAGSVTMSWGIPSELWVILATSVEPIAATGRRRVMNIPQ